MADAKKENKYVLKEELKSEDFGSIAGRKAGEAKICTKCKRLFLYMGYGHVYCPACKKIDEENFNKVREYIYEHGVASALEVSENTNISIPQIEQYLREGRLEIPENSPIFIRCEMCGGDIRSGRICPNCAVKLTNAMRIEMQIDEYQVGEKPKVNGKMRFLDSDNDRFMLKINKQKGQ